MKRQTKQHDSRVLRDRALTTLTLYAKELCPEAAVEANTIQYEDEDGRVEVFPPLHSQRQKKNALSTPSLNARRRFLPRQASISPVLFSTRRPASVGCCSRWRDSRDVEIFEQR
jgi:hypothetical protein